ncbi:MAG: queuosine precursor transporter [Myxococcales bacterium]|nr:queuosine precursor transporter [Myxococcales bacterium]MCB9626909.1 queuosine precursor transporter [Sandaracinaceae bacterium]
MSAGGGSSARGHDHEYDVDRELLPHEQHIFDDLPKLAAGVLHDRRETVFLVLSGLFLGSLTMLNILGVTRFLDLSFTLPWFGWHIPMPLAVGVLPYPLTFLCTDFLSELYGRRRANQVVWMGFGLNLWVALILWLGGALPVAGGNEDDVFAQVSALAFAAMFASMLAYLVAQLVDVHVFHFWKRRTRGKHLWLRNNGSTLVSQLVDTVAVILVTHFVAEALPIATDQPLWPQLTTFIVSGYVFKLVAALLDTGPFYLGTSVLVRYLRLPPPGELPDIVSV